MSLKRYEKKNKNKNKKKTDAIGNFDFRSSHLT